MKYDFTSPLHMFITPHGIGSHFAYLDAAARYVTLKISEGSQNKK